MSQKIPQHFIDEVLNRIDIIDIIQPRVTLKRAGQNYHGLCPFHHEKTPSFTASATKQFYHCFGCKASGNALSFLMQYDRLSFMESIELLANKAGMSLPEASYTPKSPEQQSLYSALEKATQYYEETLSQAQKAQDYLTERGLTPDIIKQFRIGYAPDNWRNLPHDIGDTKQLKQAGLAIPNKDNHYDRFRGRVLFPIRDTRGRVVAFGGRALGDEQPKYLNGPETAIFHKSRAVYGLYEAKQQQFDKLLIVEGYMDVVGLAQHGIHYGVATLGTAMTPGQLQLLLRNTDHLIFCFDGDFAGRNAAWRALERTLPLLNDGMQVHFLFLPEQEDPDSLIKKIGQEKFEALVEQATPISDFLFNHLSASINCDDIAGKAKLNQQVQQLLNHMPFGLFRQLLQEKLAAFLGVNLDQLDQSQQNTPPPSVVQTKTHQRISNPNTRQLLALLTQNPSLVKHYQPSFKTNDPDFMAFETIANLLIKHPNIKTTGQLLQHLPAHQHLHEIATEKINCDPKQQGVLFDELLKKHQKHQLDQMIQALLKKATLNPLTIKEKQLLQKLIKNKKNTVFHNK